MAKLNQLTQQVQAGVAGVDEAFQIRWLRILSGEDLHLAEDETAIHQDYREGSEIRAGKPVGELAVDCGEFSDEMRESG